MPAYIIGVALASVFVLIFRALILMVPVWWIYLMVAPSLGLPDVELGVVFGFLLLVGLTATVTRPIPPAPEGDNA